MKPFQAQCNEVKRKPQNRVRHDKKRCQFIPYQTKAILCEEQIWFEPSLQSGIFVGRCKWETHNPVYRKVDQ